MELHEVPVWKVRLLAAAAGTTASLALALFTFITLVGFVIGLVGMPVGAVVGAIFGPLILAARRPWPLVIAAGVVSAVAGCLTYVAFATLQQSRGAALTDLVDYVLQTAGYAVVVSLTLGLVMSIVGAALATNWLRRSMANPDRFVVGAIVIVGLTIAGTTLAFATAARGGQPGRGRRGADGVRVRRSCRPRDAERSPARDALLLAGGALGQQHWRDR